MPPRVSIVIPNWNGEAFLSRCVAGTLQSAQTSGLLFDVTVIDDASSDQSASRVGEAFPDVRVLHNPLNLGFGATVNRGARETEGEILVLLNNDLVPKEAMIRELVEPLLRDEEVFGVTGKALEWDGTSPNHLNMSARWSRGGFEMVWSDPPDLAPTMFLLGGCCALRREEFLRLGGLCHLFAPGYWEDYDISYLALKAGWKNLYNPRALAYHFGQGSMKRAFGEERLSVVRERNALLFTWLNVTDPQLLFEHTKSLPRLAASALASRQLAARTRARGALQALRMAGAVVRERQRRLPLLRRTDLEVLSGFESSR